MGSAGFFAGGFLGFGLGFDFYFVMPHNARAAVILPAAHNSNFTSTDGAGRFASGLHGCYRKPRTGVTIRQASIAGRLNSEVWRGSREAAHQHSNAPQIEGSNRHAHGFRMGYQRRIPAECAKNPGRQDEDRILE